MKRVFAASVMTCAAIVLLCFRILGYENTWKTIWNIPVMMPPFQDMRMITGAAQTFKAGIDPAVENVYDPSHMLFNYPQIWYPLLRTPIDLRWTGALAVTLDVLFLAAVIVFPSKHSRLSIVLLLAAIFSPAVMLGIERANVDVFFFFLVALCLFLLEISAVAALLVLLVAVLFKLFPVFGIGCFLEQESARGLRRIAVGLLLSAAYFLLTFADMQRVFRTTLKSNDVAYGVTVLVRRVVNPLAPGYGYLRFRLLHIPASVSYRDLEVAAYLLAALLIGFMIFLAARNQTHYQGSDANNLRAFRAGAGIYIGTFLLGTNYDYRLMFLLFTVPLLVEWIQRSPRRLAPILALVFLLLSLWYLEISRVFVALWEYGDIYAYLLDEFSNWALVASLTYLYVASLPPGLPAGLRSLLLGTRTAAEEARP